MTQADALLAATYALVGVDPITLSYIITHSEQGEALKLLAGQYLGQVNQVLSTIPHA